VKLPWRKVEGQTRGVGFDGFGEGAFSFFEKVAARPSWDYVASLRLEWERDVHVPMEELLDTLGDEFGATSTPITSIATRTYGLTRSEC